MRFRGYFEIGENVHWETEGHLELATRGTTAVRPESVYVCFVIVRCGWAQRELFSSSMSIYVHYDALNLAPFPVPKKFDSLQDDKFDMDSTRRVSFWQCFLPSQVSTMSSFRCTAVYVFLMARIRGQVAQSRMEIISFESEKEALCARAIGKHLRELGHCEGCLYGVSTLNGLSRPGL